MAQPPSTCQSCSKPKAEGLLNYRGGRDGVMKHESFLQCDICERFACSECLQVYDILSGYDFLCGDCAREFGTPPGERGH